MHSTAPTSRRPAGPARGLVQRPGLAARVILPLAVAATLAAVLGGCVDGKLGPGLLGPRDNTKRLTVAQLAGQLGLTVQEASPSGATLESAANVVCIYPDPAGQVYVNGALVGEGGITPAGRTLTIPSHMVAKISAKLRRARPRPRPRPQPPVRPPLPRPTAPPPTGPLVRQVAGRVVIDAGHGGGDPGAIAPRGLREKHVVLDVARQIAARLQGAGVTVMMTRSTDTTLTLEGRAAASNRFGANLFLSIHADSAKRLSARGFSTYIARSASSGSVRAAAAIERRMRSVGVPPHGKGRHRADFRVLVLTHCPAVLVELGFLTNQTDARNLASPAYRTRLAAAVADGAVDYLAGK